MFMEGPRLYFRAVVPEDAEGNYLRWMNDPEVTRFLESRYRPNSVESIQEYIRAVAGSPNDIFCAMVQKSDDRHIGNIRLGPMDWLHRRAEIGILLGEKDCWGKGYGTEAFTMMLRHAFRTMNLNKVCASVYGDNAGSCKALLKAGFQEEGRRRAQYFMDGQYVDTVVFGVLRDEFLERERLASALEPESLAGR